MYRLNNQYHLLIKELKKKATLDVKAKSATQGRQCLLSAKSKCRLENLYILLIVTRLIQHTKFMLNEFNFIILMEQLFD